MLPIPPAGAVESSRSGKWRGRRGNGQVSKLKGKAKKLYRQQRQDAQHYLLVLLDLNGVLVHRCASKAPFSVRPGTVAFLRALSTNPSVVVGFCTSMAWPNARRAINSIRETVEQERDAAANEVLRRAPIFAGDAYHFRNDVGLPLLPLRVPTLEPWRMLRNLAEVWQDPRARGHGAASTILCDDTDGKCPLTPENVCLVPSWDGSAEDADVLGSLAGHLHAAAEAQKQGGESADVREWLQSHRGSLCL